MPDLDIANVRSEDDMRVGALADGLATSATNDTSADGGSTALAGVANEINTTNNNTNTTVNDTDNSTSTHDANNDNGNNRGNDYSWDYTTKVVNATHTDTDTDIKDNGNTHTSNSGNTIDSNNDYDYTSNKSFSNTDTDVKNINHTEDSYNSTSNSHNLSVTDDDFGSLKDVLNTGNLGVAGHDVNYNIGDDFSFHFNVDNILNNSLGGEGNDTGFSLVQANNLADQDTAYDMHMNNSGANNQLGAYGGEAHSAAGVDVDSKLSWDPHTAGVGHDLTGSSTSDASAILANSGFHQELVQGANLVSNTSDVAITGGNDAHDTHSS